MKCTCDSPNNVLPCLNVSTYANDSPHTDTLSHAATSKLRSHVNRCQNHIIVHHTSKILLMTPNVLFFVCKTGVLTVWLHLASSIIMNASLGHQTTFFFPHHFRKDVMTFAFWFVTRWWVENDWFLPCKGKNRRVTMRHILSCCARAKQSYTSFSIDSGWLEWATRRLYGWMDMNIITYQFMQVCVQAKAVNVHCKCNVFECVCVCLR